MHLKNKGKYKRNLVANWAMENPIIADGEIIVVETLDGSTRLKVGDGHSTYGELPYMDEDDGLETTISEYNVRREAKATESVSTVKPSVAVAEPIETKPFVNTKATFVDEQKLNVIDVTEANQRFTDIFASKETVNPTLLKKADTQNVMLDASFETRTAELPPVQPVQEEVVTEVKCVEPKVEEPQQEEIQEVDVEETPKPKRTRRVRKSKSKVETEGQGS